MSPLDLAVLEEGQQSPPAVRLARPDDVRLVEAADRRAHARRRPSELEWLRLVRLTGGTGFTTNLIDLSEGGALLEVDGPLRPGARLTLEISGAGVEATVPLEVLRCYLASLRNGAALYRGACAFEYQIALPGSGKLSRQPAAPSDGFVGADAALAYVLDRFLPADAPDATAAPRVTLDKCGSAARPRVDSRARHERQPRSWRPVRRRAARRDPAFATERRVAEHRDGCARDPAAVLAHAGTGEAAGHAHPPCIADRSLRDP